MTTSTTGTLLAVLALGWGSALGAAEPEWKAGLLKKLEKPTSVDFVETPLRDVLKFLEAVADCRVVLDGSVDGARGVTFRARAMPASAIVSWLGFLTDSTWLLRDEAVLVCSREKAASFVKRRRRAYDVSKFAREAEHTRVVKDMVERLLRAPGGVEGATVEIEAEGHLAVTACEWDHASVARLVDALRQVPRNGKVTWEPPRPDAPELIKVVTGKDEWPDWAKEAMGKKISFDFVETPLASVVAFISNLADLCIVLDPRDTDLRKSSVTLRVADMRLESALAWVLKLVGARFAVTPHAILVAKAERIAELRGEASELHIAAYDISDILAEGWHLGEVVPIGFVPPHLPRAFAMGFGSRVVLATDAAAVDSVGTWLEQVRGPKPVVVRPDRARAAGETAPWEGRIREAMNKRISFDFVETPLQDVVSFISQLADLTIVLDTEALRDKPRRVTLKVHDMRLEAALGWVVRLCGLGSALRDEAVFISTPERTTARPAGRMVAAWGAVGNPDEARALAGFMESFLKALPDAWPGTGSLARPGYVLQVVALRPHTEVVEDLVGWLAHSKPGECHGLGDARALMLPPKPDDRLHEAMSNKVSFDFVNTPLQDVMGFVGSLGKLTIAVDPEAVKGEPRRVTLRVNDMRVESALNWMLKLVNLQCLEMDEAVFVTTPERARALRPTACFLYDVRHLIGPRRTAAELEKTVGATCQKHPEWAPSHRIAQFGGRFVVSTTVAVHSVLHEFLRRMADATSSPPKPPEPVPPPPAPPPAAKPEPRPAAAFDAAELKKGKQVDVFLKEGEPVRGKLFSASPRHISVMVGKKLIGIPMEKVQKIVQDGRTLAPSP